MYDEDYEENVHYISDQDSTDDKPQIENIINITSKKYKNESYIVKILLSEHYRDFRCKFFDRIRRTHKSMYQNIKKEIRNYLNPYRIFIDKKTEIPKEVKELYELLKSYYKERNFNNTFFINYFKDLEEAHKKRSRIVSMLPKDEIETLNDIQRKVTIIKNLRHYLNTNISERIQTNFEQKKEMFENDYFTMMYQYLVIDEDQFSKMDEKKLFEYLSSKKTSYKLRRPINDYNVYNYIPILCKGYCQEEANMFIDKFNKSITNHVEESKCEKCKFIKDQMNIINSQIRSIYLKTCIFSHNINEIMFHPLMFFSLREYLPFYQKEFKKKPIKEIYKIVQTNEIPPKFKNIKNIEIQNIYNPSDVGMKKIFDLLVEYAKNKGIYGNCCFLSEYKTSPCPIEFKPNSNDYYTHMKNCPYYHSDLEKRRINKNLENEICKEAIEDGKWLVNEEEKINCSKKDYCNKFHTRNELFFDEKNYRKLYPCTEYSYCEKGDLCPKKHATDIKIEEIYLPLESKNELERSLMRLIEKNERIRKKIDLFSRVVCKSCLNYIDGEHGRNIYFFRGCNHVICSICFKYFQTCPLCGINEDDDDDNNPKNILIKIDEGIEPKKTKKNKKNKKNKKRQKNSLDEKDEEENSEEKEEEEKENEDDDEDDSSSSSSSSDEDYDDKDSDLNMKEKNDVEDCDSDFSVGKLEFPKDNITFANNSDEESKDDNSHSGNNKGRRRGKGTQNNNIRGRYNNNHPKWDDNDDTNNTYYKRRGGKRGGPGGRGQKGNNYREGRGGYNSYYRNNNSYYYNKSYNNYNNYNNYDNYGNNDNDESYDYYNESSQASSNRRGKGKKRGGRGGGKSYQDDSSRYDNKNQYEEDRKSSDNDDDNDNGSDHNDISMVQNNRKGRGNASGKGVVRGGKKIRGGKSRSDYKKEDSDDSNESNDNVKNSKQSSKINNNDDCDEASD